MFSGELILGGLNAAAFLLCVSFIAYVVLIVVPFLRRRPATPGDSSRHSWHFVVPCLDEEAVIGATVQRLRTTFPAAQVWCIDDASGDGTPFLLARLARRDPGVHVVTRRLPEAQRGKGMALNAAWQAISDHLPPGADRHRVVVGVVDADGHLDPDCLDMIAGPDYFGDGQVGAVQIEVRVESRQGAATDGAGRFGRALIRLQDLEFAGVIAAMQTLRRHVGSVGMGGNGQFTRLSVLDEVAGPDGTPWHGALLEDFELGLHVLLSGSRTEYCHDTAVTQEGLPTLRRLVRQRSRWAQGSMQCMQYLLPILRSPRVSTAGALEISYFLLLPWLQLLGGLVYLLSTLVLVWYALTFPGGISAWIGAGAWGILPLFLMFGLGPLAVWGPVYRATAEPGLSRSNALLLGVANWPYAMVHQLATWWAFARVVRARRDWKKTARLSAAGTRHLATSLPLISLPGTLHLGASSAAPPSRVLIPGRLRLPSAASPYPSPLSEVS